MYGTVQYHTLLLIGAEYLIIWKNCYSLETYHAIMIKRFSLGHQVYQVYQHSSHPPVPSQPQLIAKEAES
jgi:hypothetical protein